MTLTDEVYVCSAGETFDSVSLEIFGDEKYACELLTVNPEYSDTPIFEGGEVLDIPLLEIENVEDGESYMRPKAPWKG